jgi:hypothetical protein
MFLLQLPIWSYLLVGAAVLAIIIGLMVGRQARQERLEDVRRARIAADILRTLSDEGVKRAVGISTNEAANK